MLWTYADRNADGSYRRIGGGPYDAATDTYGQGAFNADDISRAAVVYLRHWRRHARRAQPPRGLRAAARARLHADRRGRTPATSCCGCSPTARSTRARSRSSCPTRPTAAPSYWLARTVWALGEGYREFKRVDPAFARFLRERLDLASPRWSARCSSRYGKTQVVDGLRVPGVADRRRRRRHRRGDARPRRLRRRRRRRRGAPRGAARASARAWRAMGPARRATWPYGAVLPWALSRSIWHAWASQMPAALAATRAAATCSRPRSPTPPPSPRTCWSPAARTTAGSRRRPTAPRSPTAPTAASRACSRSPTPPGGRPAPARRGRGHLVLRQQRGRRRRSTTRRPGATFDGVAARRHAEPELAAPSPPSTACSR